MGVERAATPKAVEIILDWEVRRKAVESIDEIAAISGVSRSTVCRIAKHGGYPPGKRKRRKDALVRSTEIKVSIETNVSHQERV